MSAGKGVDARIAKRHNNIPQEPLPLGPVDATGGGEEVKKRYVKSIAYATCPDHVAGLTLTGVVVDNFGRRVFRDHTKRVGRQTMPCPGSGRPAPDTTTKEPR